MTPIDAYSQYKENSIYTSSPEELTLMLYNGLVKFIMQAIHSMEEGRLDKASSSLVRAQDIVSEFRSTLDQKYAVSQSLIQIYDYMYRRLLEANMKKDSDIAKEILGYARELRDTWSQAMKLAKQSPRAQTAAQAPAQAEQQRQAVR